MTLDKNCTIARCNELTSSIAISFNKKNYLIVCLRQMKCLKGSLFRPHGTAFLMVKISRTFAAGISEIIIV